jgi:chemotaxis protein methyltransferase WspC
VAHVGAARTFAPLPATSFVPSSVASVAPVDPISSSSPSSPNSPVTKVLPVAKVKPRDDTATADIRKLLEQARIAADAGDFVPAVALCRKVLATDRANAQAEYLLGLVEDARGDAQGALIHYRRALYLDPGHYEALVHCAAQLNVRGDTAGAQRLLERAARAEREAGAKATEPHDPAHRDGTRHR